MEVGTVEREGLLERSRCVSVENAVRISRGNVVRRGEEILIF